MELPSSKDFELNRSLKSDEWAPISGDSNQHEVVQQLHKVLTTPVR
jgi:hypothetical protein